MDARTYAEPGPLTTLHGAVAASVGALPRDVAVLCRVAQELVTDAADPTGVSLPPDRLEQRSTRSAQRLLEQILTADPSPLDAPRSAEQRVVGTCRTFTLLATALLRAHGVPARARCGFASYFVADRWVDHWIVEHRAEEIDRWIRVDAEVLDLDVIDDAEDLGPARFWTGGEAWQAVRSGAADPMAFGVAGTENWGPGEIRGNAIRDLAALHRIEVLPWDEWGPMAASYAGTTDEVFDAEIDDLAAATATEDDRLLADAWARFAVPDHLVG